jgi:hypothetical protein
MQQHACMLPQHRPVHIHHINHMQHESIIKQLQTQVPQQKAAAPALLLPSYGLLRCPCCPAAAKRVAAGKRLPSSLQ